MALVLAAALLASWFAAAPAVADVPTYYVPPTNQTAVLGHKCSVIGTDGIGNEAVHCADIAIRGTATKTEVWATDQVLCQRNGVTFACQDVTVTAEVAFVFNGTAEVGRKQSYCSSQLGFEHCPSTRFTYSSNHWIWSTDYCFEMWAVSINPYVTTKNNIQVTGANRSSAHYNVCPAVG